MLISDFAPLLTAAIPIKGLFLLYRAVHASVQGCTCSESFELPANSGRETRLFGVQVALPLGRRRGKLRHLLSEDIGATGKPRRRVSEALKRGLQQPAHLFPLCLHARGAGKQNEKGGSAPDRWFKECLARPTHSSAGFFAWIPKKR